MYIIFLAEKLKHNFSHIIFLHIIYCLITMEEFRELYVTVLQYWSTNMFATITCSFVLEKIKNRKINSKH